MFEAQEDNSVLITKKSPTRKPKRTPKPTRRTRRPSQPSSEKRRIRAADRLAREDWKDGECSGKKLSERCEELNNLVCRYRRSTLSSRQRRACQTAGISFGRRRPSENEELVEKRGKDDGERPGHRTPKPKRTPKPTRRTRRPSQPSSEKRRIRAADRLAREDWKDGECSGKKLSERCEELNNLVCRYRRSTLSRRQRSACETAGISFGRRRPGEENEELVESEEEQDLVMKEE